ncbi:MAG: hypothetical protein ACRCWG_03810 [Sarcina sp.]
MDSFFLSILDCFDGIFDIKAMSKRKSRRGAKIMGIAFVLALAGIMIFFNYISY